MAEETSLKNSNLSEDALGFRAEIRRHVREQKVDFFFRRVERKSRILDVGAANGWLGEYLRRRGLYDYTSLDLKPPADIVGDIHDWSSLGLQSNTFDIVVAFEIVEHTNCWDECWELLKPGGVLFVTCPVPKMDGICRLCEFIGINQKRTSPHNHLIDLMTVERFQYIHIQVMAFMCQWGILRKPSAPDLVD